MNWNGKIPRYAIRLVVLLVVFATVFFGGLRLFVPEGSKLTGSYDAAYLRDIASAPVSYHGSDTCGVAGCHTEVQTKWSEGAHGARQEQSKCEVCHGPLRDHPNNPAKLPKVRGDGDVAALCLSCHRKLRARAASPQPQISPDDHPFPHKGVLVCTQCHDPHSPALGAPKPPTASPNLASATTRQKPDNNDVAKVASTCFGCHGVNGRGGFAPALAGMSVPAMKEKLTNFKTGAATGTMMNPIAAGLDDRQIDALARFFVKGGR